MTKLQRRAVELVILRQGLKAQLLTAHLVTEFESYDTDNVIKELIDLIAEGKLVEVEYNLPDNLYGSQISKSFLLPKGTSININKV